MALLTKFKPEIFLRLGLGLTYLYSGYDILVHPTAWIWAITSLPQFLKDIIAVVGFENFLRIQGAGELLFAFVFLAWFIPGGIVKWAALFTAMEMALILLLVGIDPITFRDFGLLGAASALLVIYSSGYKQVRDF